ncbi:RloB family protein [Sphaerochaeta sp. S2]|uniref:RloB family protein n=1 Tax=Sphaerochaeta sp. S2 TaxID=2798868 RepID=UPI0018E913BF|nr:RloB domain-containing protein [Sphaerochaeta sp. S2]
MSKKQHDGKRSPRSKRAFRIPDLGYYLILTDTNETELNYFQGIRDSLPKDLQNRLVIKVLPKIETKNLVSRCLEELDKNAQYRIPWIVFDRDEVKGFDTIINEAKKNHIHTGWSNPCFEIWLHEYLEKAPLSMDSVGCCHTFSTTFKKITKQEYPKFPKFCNYESGQSVSNGSSSPTFISLPFHGYSTLNRSKMSR